VVLRAAGLTPTEEAAYLLLVRRGPASVPQLARRLGVAEQRTRRVVAGLQGKGLVHRTPPPRERVVAVPPEVGVEQLVQRRVEELEQVRASAHRLVAEARGRAGGRRTDELVEVVQGRASVLRAFERVQREAGSEVLVFVTPPYAFDGRLNSTELARLRAGISYRAVYGVEALEEPGFLDTVAPHVQAGEQARVFASVPIKLAVADRSIAMLPLSWTSTADDFAAVLVHPCGLLGALVALFESVWTMATPLVPATAAEPEAGAGQPTGEDLALLSLLVSGLTDEAVAARLGMSRRTVVRRVGALMALAGARSRLQLGWVARERGWL
jgi:sugar-specific transcriptional regulator TrmB